MVKSNHIPRFRYIPKYMPVGYSETNTNIYKLPIPLSGMSSLKSSIKVSKELRKFLIKNSTSNIQTFEDIIWMLIGTNTLTKEQKLTNISRQR